MWFRKKDIKINDKDIVYLDDLQGYVLPHDSTQYTGRIISDTLRYRPSPDIIDNIETIVIIYLPSHNKPNVKNRYYHEFYVVWNALAMVYTHVDFIGFNVLTGNINELYNTVDESTLVVASVDFSHFLPFKQALVQENCAAHSLMHKQLKGDCMKHVDDVRTFKVLFDILGDVNMQWIGRTRSPGLKGVGYHSYLLRGQPQPTRHKPQGFFVTAYDRKFQQRECLGNWTRWTQEKENKLVEDVVTKGSTTSRLTGGKYLNIPVEYYTVTYLYKERNTNKAFIRGWHGILMDAFYLPDVFLENTFEDGRWITPQDDEWPEINSKQKFEMTETFNKLQNKAGSSSDKNHQKPNKNYVLYTSHVKHKKYDKYNYLKLD